MVAAVLTWSYHEFGSLSLAARYVAGDRIIVDPEKHVISGATPGDERKLMVRVSNWTGKTIRFLGCSATCTCAVIDEEFPFELGPNSGKDLQLIVKVRPKKDDGAVQSDRIDIYTNCAEKPILTVVVTVKM